MIYVNKNIARIIVPRVNQSPEYEQNKVVDIIVTNQVTKETRELQLIDESTDKNYYEFDNPLHYDVRGYEGTYDYKIVFGNGSVVLSSGIVVVEPDNVADNTIDVKSYEYYPDKIVQYTPNTEYVPQVESIKEIKQNGDYWVKYYDRVIVDVPIPDITEFEQEIENLNTELTQKEAYINTAQGITIISNGTYTPEEGVIGYNEINVEVENLVTLDDGTKFGYSTLTEIPENFDFSEVTDFYRIFYNCYKLTSVPQQLDTSKGTNFSHMFSGCNNLTSVPQQLDTSNGTSFDYMFNGCEKLTSVPQQLDTSKGTDFGYMFGGCTSLTSVPQQLDTSNGIFFNYMFYNCYKLTSVPQLDLSKGTNFNRMFSDCDKLTSVGNLDTSNGTDFQQMFYYCMNLTTIQQLNLSKGTNLGSSFYECRALENITLEGSVNKNIDFSYSTLLTYDSIKSILTACAATTNTSAKTLKFKRTIADNNGELAALVGECTTKGWTITGLTLE